MNLLESIKLVVEGKGLDKNKTKKLLQKNFKIVIKMLDDVVEFDDFLNNDILTDMHDGLIKVKKSIEKSLKTV